MSSNIIRVAIPPYDATTDTDPDHYALIGDEDWVLIKEKERGSVTVSAASQEAITHSLGYIPLAYVFGNFNGDEWVLVTGQNDSIAGAIEVTTTQLIIKNTGASAVSFKYYILYDQQV